MALCCTSSSGQLRVVSVSARRCQPQQVLLVLLAPGADVTDCDVSAGHAPLHVRTSGAFMQVSFVAVSLGPIMWMLLGVKVKANCLTRCANWWCMLLTRIDVDSAGRVTATPGDFEPPGGSFAVGNARS